MSDAIDRAAVREQIAQALHGDQCPDNPDPGESCMCGSGDFHRQADIALDVLREAGLLAPAPLREAATAEELDALLYSLNESGVEPVIPVVDAQGVSALAYLLEVGGDEAYPFVCIGGEDLPSVAGIERDQPTSWLTYPVKVLHVPADAVDRAEGDGRSDG